MKTIPERLAALSEWYGEDLEVEPGAMGFLVEASGAAVCASLRVPPPRDRSGAAVSAAPPRPRSGHHLPATAEERAVSVALLRQLAALIRPDAPGAVSIRSMEILLDLPRYTLTRLTPEKAPRRMSERVRGVLVGEIGRRTPRTKKGEK